MSELSATNVLFAVHLVPHFVLQYAVGTLSPYSTEEYGTDTTYYFATTSDAQPTPAPQPDAR